MKLLLDNNLSHRLIEKLNDLFPNSTHVMLENLDESDDTEIWNFAKEGGYVIITKDSDYSDLNILLDHPPKVIWLRVGNSRVEQVENIVRNNIDALNEFFKNSDMGLIELD